MYDLAKIMREQLAEVGITIDNVKPNLRSAKISTQSSATVDRQAIRRTLIERDADESSIEWLTASCPSLEAARNFKPPRKP